MLNDKNQFDVFHSVDSGEADSRVSHVEMYSQLVVWVHFEQQSQPYFIP